MNINLKNREKYIKYSQLLWNFAYSVNKLQTSDAQSLSVYSLIQKCFNEYRKIQEITNPWKFDWENTDIESLVHVGDYFCSVINDHSAIGCPVSYDFIKVTDIIDSKTGDDSLTKSVYYQCIHLSNYAITISGKDIANTDFSNYDRTMFIKPFCANIFDGIYIKIDEKVWNDLIDSANSISEQYKKASIYGNTGK